MSRLRSSHRLCIVRPLGRGSSRPLPRRRPRAKALRLGVVAVGLTIAGFGAAVPSALAAATTTVDLGQSSTYAVFSGASVGNTVNAPTAPHTTLRGDLGVKPLALPTGFPPGVVTGATEVGTMAAAAAHADLVTRTRTSPLGRAVPRSRPT